MDIRLNDILHLTKEQIDNSKISLNISSGKGARLCLDSWLKWRDSDLKRATQDGFWAWYGIQRNFRVNTLCFAFYKLDWGGDRYLLVESGRITKVPELTENLPAEYEPLSEYQKYNGRLVINVYKGNTQGRYNFNLKKFIDSCEVVQILPERFGMKDFPGYKNLTVNYEQLYRGIYLSDSWKTALKLQKGVYVITDTAPDDEYSGLGRLYIGSATSDKGMLYDRWKCYADILTGGNKELNKVLLQKGREYIKKYFRWTLIEHFNEDTEDSDILKRERYWKDALDSEKHGLNDN